MIWVRSRDHNTVPGTQRRNQTAIGMNETVSIEAQTEYSSMKLVTIQAVILFL